MKTDSLSPQVASLRSAVEKTFGRQVRTSTDFSLLASAIEASTSSHISDSTLRRVWNYAKPYESISLWILDVLAKYAGYGHWDDFLKFLSTRGAESEIVPAADAVEADSLAVGDRLRIGWRPDRLCVVEYLGEHRFRAVETSNSKLKAGDTFSCAVFLRGRALYVDNLCHEGIVSPSYGMGLDHGLSTLEKL